MSIVHDLKRPGAVNLVPLESPLRVCALPGTDEVLVSHAERLSRLDSVRRTVTEVAHDVLDKWDDPVLFCSLCAVAGDRVLAASKDAIHDLRLDAKGVTEVEQVAHGSKAHTSVIRVRANRTGNVAVVTTGDFLGLVSEPVTGRHVGLSELRRVHGKEAPDRFWLLAVAPGGEHVATAGPGGEVELRDPATLEVRRVLEGLHAVPNALAFSPDGRWLVGADRSWRLRRWLVETGAVEELEVECRVTDICWLSDSSGFVAVEEVPAIALYGATDTSPIFHAPQEGLRDDCFDDATLVGDRLLVVVVAQRGLAVAPLV